MRRLPVWCLFLGLCGLLQACAALQTGISRRIAELLPADAILLGEQHDAREHQQLQRDAVLELVRQNRLAALVIEMAAQGSSTVGLPRQASEAEVRFALRWDERSWPWAAYGPVVMAAVQAGAPVLGANLERSAMRDAMGRVALDAHLPVAAMEQQRARIRTGHCDLLSPGQIGPVTRIQIARDAAMAQAVTGAMQAGKTVLLVAGGGHVTRRLGVPTHLLPNLRSVVVLMVAGKPDAADRADADVVWETVALPPKDHCAELAHKLGR